MMSGSPGGRLRLLAGYNGARNTGSDVRVAALARQLQDLLGDEVELSVMSLDVSSTAPYFNSAVRQIPLSNNEDGFVITEVLRSLDALVTSQFHAQVLSMEALVPTVAVSMDERLDNLAHDLGTQGKLLQHKSRAGSNHLLGLYIANAN